MRCGNFVCVYCDPTFPSSVPPGPQHEVYDHVGDPILRAALRERDAEKK